MHEAQLHRQTCFLTLTIDDAHLTAAAPTSQSLVGAASPAGFKNSRSHKRQSSHRQESSARTPLDQAPSTLNPAELQLFTKRTNEFTRREKGTGIRYFAVGEYGEKTGRPHYHAVLFNQDFSKDRVFWKKTRAGHPLYRSPTLAKLWPQGNADIGALTFESAAYTARYIMKKINGPMALSHYHREDKSGNHYQLQPEFCRMSRRPGLGTEWFRRFKDAVYPQDQVIVRGFPAKPPRFYDQLLKASQPELMEVIKETRAVRLRPENQTPDRLRAAEEILDALLLLKTKDEL